MSENAKIYTNHDNYSIGSQSHNAGHQ